MSDPTVYGSIRVHGLTLEKLARLIADEDLTISGPFTVEGNTDIGGGLQHDGSVVGFYAVEATNRQEIVYPNVGDLPSTFLGAMGAVSGTGDDNTIDANFRLVWNWINDLMTKLALTGICSTGLLESASASDGATVSDSATVNAAGQPASPASLTITGASNE